MTITVADIDQILVGRFYIEINNEDDPYPLHPSAWNQYKPKEVNMGFWAEKRIHQVVLNEKADTIMAPNLFGTTWRAQTKDEFVESFNPDEKRYRRLLTARELELVFDWYRKKQF